MLDTLRKQGASVFIYLIFGLLIVIFVINFAPSGGAGGGGGCMGQSTTPLTVDGHKANQASYKVAYAGNQESGRRKVYDALELLIRREILAQEAEARGVLVTGDMVDEEIKRGTFFIGGNRQRANYWFDQDDDGERVFNFGKLKSFVNNLNVSMNSYKEEQIRGMQAAVMGEIMMSKVRVSRDEAYQDFLYQHDTATYDAVAFSPTTYRTAMRLSADDVARFLATHEDDVKKKFAADERTYKATKPSLELRSIFIAKVEPPAAPTLEEGASSAAVAKPADTEPVVGMSIDAAKAKLETARTAIAGDKRKFADAAKQLATADADKAAGGYVGWRPVENAGLGEPAVNDAVKALKPGEMTAVISTDTGVFLVLAENKREGDLAYDAVKNEIATDLAKDMWAKEAAKRAALSALVDAHAGTGKSLDQLFSPDPEVVKRKMQEQIQEQMQQQFNMEQLQKKSGFWTPPVDTRDVPAAWTAEDPVPNASAPGGGSSNPSPVPAAGSGSAALAPTALPPTTPLPATTTALAPSKDQLPSFGEVRKPFLETWGPVPRASNLPAIGDNKEAIAALFTEMKDGNVSKQVYEVNGTYVLFQLKSKEAPNDADFAKDADEKIEHLRLVRGALMLEHWIGTRCRELARNGKIEPMQELIRETDDKGNPTPTVYQPCWSFGQ